MWRCRDGTADARLYTIGVCSVLYGHRLGLEPDFVSRHNRIGHWLCGAVAWGDAARSDEFSRLRELAKRSTQMASLAMQGVATLQLYIPETFPRLTESHHLVHQRGVVQLGSGTRRYSCTSTLTWIYIHAQKTCVMGTNAEIIVPSSCSSVHLSAT